MNSYYQISSDNWEAFIKQCERALIKAGLYATVNKRYDWWSSLYGDNGYSHNGNFHSFREYDENKTITVWDGLKKYGHYSYNGNGVAIDFDFQRIVYAETWDYYITL